MAAAAAIVESRTERSRCAEQRRKNEQKLQRDSDCDTDGKFYFAFAAKAEDKWSRGEGYARYVTVFIVRRCRFAKKSAMIKLQSRSEERS